MLQACGLWRAGKHTPHHFMNKPRKILIVSVFQDSSTDTRKPFENARIQFFPPWVTTRPPHPFLQTINAIVSRHCCGSRCSGAIPRAMVPGCNHIRLCAPRTRDVRRRLHALLGHRANLCSSGDCDSVRVHIHEAQVTNPARITWDACTFLAVPASLTQPLNKASMSPGLPQNMPKFGKVSDPICTIRAKADIFGKPCMSPGPLRRFTPSHIQHALSQGSLPTSLSPRPVRHVNPLL